MRRRASLVGRVVAIVIAVGACHRSTERTYDDVVSLECDVEKSGSNWELHEQLTIDADLLRAELEWGGGCGSSHFELCSSEVTATATGELAATLFLLHEFDDPCEATLYQTLEIDISPIADAARGVADEPHGEIVLTLDGGARLEKYLTVTYAF